MKQDAIPKILVALIVTSILCSSTTVNAEDTQIITQDNQTQTVNVTATIASSYTVTVPKEIILSTTEDTIFAIKVIGDLAAKDSLMVGLSSNTLTMQTDGQLPVTTGVTLAKEQFKYSDIVTEQTVQCTIKKPVNIASGTWNGVLTFTTSLVQD